MKYFFLWMIALFLSGVMAFSSTPQGLMANQDTVTLDSPVDSKTDSYIDLSIPKILPISENRPHDRTSVSLTANKVANLEKGNAARQYKAAIGRDRSGKVLVIDAVSGEVIRTLQMGKGVVVRNSFILESGKTVAASGENSTVFWDLETGREIRRFPQRIYGFSQDESMFFTWQRSWGKSDIFVYSYPDLKQTCKMLASTLGGPDTFHFSPNDRFLAVDFYNGEPVSDKEYISPPPGFIHGMRATYIFDIQKCEMNEEFSKLWYWRLGKFTTDSNFYMINLNHALRPGQPRIWGECYYNLNNNKLENCTKTTPPPPQPQQRFIP